MERKYKKKHFTVLAFDPSARGFGWSIIQGTKVLVCGCIKTEPKNKKLRIRKGDDDIRRISEINFELREIIDEHKIKFIVSELPHGSQNAAAAKLLAMVSSQVQTIADILRIGIEWYSEADAKRIVLRKQTATKQEMINAIDKLYTVPWKGIKYKDEAIADSIAIYHVAREQSPTLKVLSKR